MYDYCAEHYTARAADEYLINKYRSTISLSQNRYCSDSQYCTDNLCIPCRREFSLDDTALDLEHLEHSRLQSPTRSRTGRGNSPIERVDSPLEGGLGLQFPLHSGAVSCRGGGGEPQPLWLHDYNGPPGARRSYRPKLHIRDPTDPMNDLGAPTWMAEQVWGCIRASIRLIELRPVDW
jgi:hypothetical protein